MSTSVYERCIYYFKLVLKIAGIYIFWICIHYTATHLYIQLCTPFTFHGFILSPFMAGTLHCKAIRWAVNSGANTIDTMWVVLGSWLCAQLFITPSDKI